MTERSANEMEPILEALRRWALGHPRSEQAFMVVRGHAFTPKSFLEAATQGSEFAQPFFDYLFEEAPRQDMRPQDLINRDIINQRR